MITILSIPRNFVLSKHLAANDLTSLTKNIKKNLHEENIGCGIFVGLQKAIDTAKHDCFKSM